MASNPSHGGLVGLGFTIGITVLSTILIILRFWSRRMTRFGLWWDDWFAVATLLCLYAVLVLSAWVTYMGGIGKPIEQAVTDQSTAVTEVLKALYGFEFVYLFASPLMKVTVLAYYWRMFPNRSIKLGVLVLSAICGVWFVCVLFGNLLECVPISHFWDLTGEGYCRFPATMYSVVVAIPNTIIDIFTVLLPIWEIWHLKLSFWKRVGVCTIFFLGGIVVIASIVRLALLIVFHNQGTANLTEDVLLPWYSTAVEIGVAIIGSCLPCLLPLYRRVRYGSPDSRPTNNYGYGSHQGSKRGMPPTQIHSKLSTKNHHKGFPTKDDGGPFERLSTTNTGTSGVEEDNFGQPAVHLHNHNYHAKASVVRTHTHKVGSEHDIPLEGINVHREFTVHRSDSILGQGDWPSETRV